MSLPSRITTDAITEPITLTEAKAHLRVLSTTDDDYISGLIASAREFAETMHDTSYAEKTVECVADYVGDYELPVKGLSSLTSVVVTDSNGSISDITSQFILDTYRNKLIYNGNGVSDLAKVNPVAITYVATGTPSKKVKQAMLLLIGHWYEHREEASSGGLAQIPMAADTILKQEFKGVK